MTAQVVANSNVTSEAQVKVQALVAKLDAKLDRGCPSSIMDPLISCRNALRKGIIPTKIQMRITLVSVLGEDAQEVAALCKEQGIEQVYAAMLDAVPEPKPVAAVPTPAVVPAKPAQVQATLVEVPLFVEKLAPAPQAKAESQMLLLLRMVAAGQATPEEIEQAVVEDLQKKDAEIEARIRQIEEKDKEIEGLYILLNPANGVGKDKKDLELEAKDEEIARLREQIEVSKLYDAANSAEFDAAKAEVLRLQDGFKRVGEMLGVAKQYVESHEV